MCPIGGYGLNCCRRCQRRRAGFKRPQPDRKPNRVKDARVRGRFEKNAY